ncbi:hypothetical protein Taro_033572 [Colocasia esculenta]|uniref:NAD-dependent epimerase/dehydratase domain-containing protein n=1 Tax=Colocasia esculenta TaxID=4460 RepID=A0A843W9D2_COLES|nr:hypothetical protein [Colocasia esculenta]
MVVWRHTWPSRHGRDGGECRILVTASGGVATAFLTDVTASLRFDCLWGRAGGGRRDMVAMPRGVATWLLSRRADPSCFGGRRFKTEVLVVLVLRWCRPVRAGDAFVLLGARRRWSFLREGPNMSALLVEGELLDAEVKGTVNILRAAKECGVRRVVTTSSISAIIPSPGWPADVVKDEECWTEVDYCSKTLAEKAAWKFAEENGLDVVVVNPGTVMGPVLPPVVNASMGMLVRLLQGFLSSFKFDFCWCHARFLGFPIVTYPDGYPSKQDTTNNEKCNNREQGKIKVNFEGHNLQEQGKIKVNFDARNVSHHPLMSAGHAENEHFAYDVTSKLKTKFLGNSVDVYPVGRLFSSLQRLFVGESQYAFHSLEITRTSAVQLKLSTPIIDLSALDDLNAKKSFLCGFCIVTVDGQLHDIEMSGYGFEFYFSYVDVSVSVLHVYIRYGQGRDKLPGCDMVAPGEPAMTWLCGDTPGCRDMVATGVDVAFLSRRLEAL